MLIYEFPSSSLRCRANPNLFRRSFEPFDQMLYHRIVLEPHTVYLSPTGTRYILLTVEKTVFEQPGPSSKRNRVLIILVIRPPVAPVLIARPSTALATPQPVIISEPPVLTTPQILLPDPPRPLELTTLLTTSADSRSTFVDTNTSLSTTCADTTCAALFTRSTSTTCTDSFTRPNCGRDFGDDPYGRLFNRSDHVVNIWRLFATRASPGSYPITPGAGHGRCLPCLTRVMISSHSWIILAIEQQETPMDLTMPRLKKKGRKTIGFKVIKPLDLSIHIYLPCIHLDLTWDKGVKLRFFEVARPPSHRVWDAYQPQTTDAYILDFTDCTRVTDVYVKWLTCLDDWKMHRDDNVPWRMVGLQPRKRALEKYVQCSCKKAVANGMPSNVTFLEHIYRGQRAARIILLFSN
ncbi:hypothetical protein TNCV_2043611 [Trichonephila clavipes]|nr:hypothetical protein TNCV_2043611 [Trichonephila clavipes]